MGVTLEIFQALGNVHAAKELLNMLVRIGRVAGRLYLSIYASRRFVRMKNNKCKPITNNYVLERFKNI